ncbi:MAG: DUF3570 domain-containing protein, partial [Opitutales bacterium]
MQKIPSTLPAPAKIWVRAGCLTAVLWICQPRSAKAEDSLTYKYSSYAEDDHRIKVNSNYALAQADLGTDTSLKIMGVTDSIAGATPTGALPQVAGQSVPTAYMHDYRRAVDVDAAHQFKAVNVDLGYAMSTESDYVSRGWSVNTLTDFNQKNTRLLLGYAGTNDTIREPLLGWTTERNKKGTDFIAGLTQLLNPNDSLTANVTVGRSNGYLDDPYKIVSTTRLAQDPGTYYTIPENRPRDRQKFSVFVGSNINFPNIDGALDSSYRFYHDSFGINSHTATVRWLQSLGDDFILEPSLRYYLQSAASFYHYSLDNAGIVTSLDKATGETGTGQAPYYSSDYRLSRMATVDVGLKLTWKFNAHLALDAAFDRYTTHGLDHLTPQDVYSKARIITVGV